MNQQKMILLVEDNEKIMEANRRALADAEYRIEMAFDLAEARASLARREPDVIVLDILLPDGNGLNFLQEIRKTTAAPVLLLTALDEKDDILAGLRAGGDDYITKPYDLDELRERVAAFIRRREMYELRTPDRMTRGPLTLDLIAQQAYLDGKDLFLSQKEYALLLMLTQNEGKAIDSAALYETVWRAPMVGDGNAVWQQMARLKKKLEAGAGQITLTAARGAGYKLKIEEE